MGLRWLWLRRDWLWSADDPDAGAAQWAAIPRGKPSLMPKSCQLWLRPRGRAIPRGWYLILLQHRGNNPRTTGYVRSGCWGFVQGRPMYPTRRRFRVLHLNRTRSLTFELQQVNESIQVYRLLLIRLPGWDAWRRIRKRLNRLDQHAPTTRSSCWRYYNHLLNSQARRHSIVTYRSWQLQREQPLLKSLLKLSQMEKSLFVLQTVSGQMLSPVNSDQWVVLMRPGSTIATWAIQAFAAQLRELPTSHLPLVFYGDEDQCTAEGLRHSPRFKPAWNRELFWSDPLYSCHWVVSGRFWNRLLEMLPALDWWSVQYALLAQAEARQSSDASMIRHLPLVVAHVERVSMNGSAQAHGLQMSRAYALKAPTLETIRLGHRLQWCCPAQTLLSVIIPTRDQLPLLQACLRSIQEFPAGVDLELIVVDNGSVEVSTLDFLNSFGSRPNQKVLRDDGPFNYSALNNRAARLAQGSVLLLLNNDVEFISRGWGSELAANASRHDVGCVGGQLRYPDGTIQHGGVILGIGGMASHAHAGCSADELGYQGRLQLAQEFSAVTAACLAISREHWQQLGGLDDEHLWVNYNDVDLCLRAQQSGLHNIYLPQVKAIHHESKSRGRPEGASYRLWRREWSVMEQRWGHLLDCDPAYSPWLTLENEQFDLSLRTGSIDLR